MKTVSEIKKVLIEHGISTSTPGLNGDDRLEALNYRLEQHLNKNGRESRASKKSSPLKLSSPIAPPPLRSPPKVTQETLEIFNELSMAELRSRLAALGENTTTPGLNGEERRVALIKRLTDAVCGDNDSEESEEEEEVIKNPSPIREVN